MFKLHLLPLFVLCFTLLACVCAQLPPPLSNDASNAINGAADSNEINSSNNNNADEPVPAPEPSANPNDEPLPSSLLHLLPLPLTVHAPHGLRTIIAPETLTIHAPTLAKVGEVVHHVPTAVSHQSQTIVHQRARVVTPVVAPAVRTITTHLLRAYHVPPPVLVAAHTAPHQTVVLTP